MILTGSIFHEDENFALKSFLHLLHLRKEPSEDKAILSGKLQKTQTGE